MIFTRREFLKGSAMGIAGVMTIPRLLAQEARGVGKKIRISARHFSGNFEQAKEAGLEGVEVGVGGAAEKLRIADLEARQKIKDMVKATGVVVSSLSMDLMNGHPSGTDPQAPAWLAQTVEAAGELGAAGILLPFFGKAELLENNEFKKVEVDGLVGRLKEIAPAAKKAGVSIGIESTLSAKMFLELLDRVGSDAVGAYYDIGNSTNKGLDVPADIRDLKGRITMIHFKDGRSFLGEGKVKMEPVCEAIKAIDYKGWIVLETSCPTKDVIADCKRNADFSRKLLGL
ncbi:MAG: sugar phosphate isomerase/epimerase [Kiritimatiellae bacterium]|nr:sugar phosphate isomerase/epimerase [Kiritimatiellia bacterium]MDD5522405.1 sugar phosphate isomerase/epimerase [Kiritimatiellia bacterium]